MSHPIKSFKSFAFKLEAVQADGKIRGFASTFGNVDQGGDVVDKGAFAKTIRESKGLWPILADHDPCNQIGWNTSAEETDRGLYVEGQLNMKVQKAVERFELCRQAIELGADSGLSIGYRTIKAVPDSENPMIRRLKELQMWEYSMVTFPMNQEAMVTAAKNLKMAKNLDELAHAISIEAKAMGVSLADLASALLGTKAGDDESVITADPAFGQSLDDLLAALKAG